MSSERRPPDVRVLPATPEQAPVLANLLELYARDMSAYFDVRLGADGRFDYPALSLYWREEARSAAVAVWRVFSFTSPGECGAP